MESEIADTMELLENYIDAQVEKRIQTNAKITKALDVAIDNGKMIKKLLESNERAIKGLKDTTKAFEKITKMLEKLLKVDNAKKRSYVS